MKILYGLLIILFMSVTPCLADQDVASIIEQMRSTLDLQSDQVTNVTPIIERYADLFAQFQKSVSDGTINASSVDSQRQQLEAQETQELSQYLKPYQLSEWRTMQAQTEGGGDSNNADEYSNLPNNPSNNPSQN